MSRFRRAEDLFHAVSELPPEDRDAFLDDACGSDAELRGEIQELLALLDQGAPADLQTPLPDRTSAAGAGGEVPEDLQAFGPYTLLNEVARGGQGVVYLAEDTRLRRRVALKVLSAGAAQFQAMRVRLLREAEAASRLDHPNICSVYEVGEVDGLPFIAMRFVEGKTLARIIHEGRSAAGSTEPPSSTNRNELLGTVAIIEQAARALHAAHEVGLVHRDVKPGNIMITPAGNPVLVDFGLVHDEESAAHVLTQTGQLLGTPAYMAPEQIASGRIQVDRRTDVYALGVTLFEALTLRRPFEAPTRDRLYHQILEADAPDPRGLNPRIPKDLKVVLEVSLEKDPNQRYQTALDLAEDLKRIRALEPIQARPTPLVIRSKRWVQRNRVVAAFLVLITVGLLATFWSLQGTQRALDHSRMLNLVAASDEALEQDATLALLLAREAVALEQNVDSISALHRALAEPHPMAILLKDRVHDEDRTVYSPDGQRLITFLDDRRSVTIWSVSGSKIGAFKADTDIKEWGISPAGDLLALRVGAGESPGRVEFWNDRGERVRTVGGDQGRVARLLVRPPARECLIVFGDGSAARYDWSGRRIAARGVGVAPIRLASFSADGDALVVADAEGKLHLLSGGGKLVRSLKQPVENPVQLLFSDEDRCIVARLESGSVVVWNVERSDDVITFGSNCTGLEVSDRGARILTHHGEDAPRHWDLSGRQVGRPAISRPLRAALILPTGGCVTLDKGGQLCFWDEDGGLVRAHQSPGDGYEELHCSPTAWRVLVTFEHARLYDLRGNLLQTHRVGSRLSQSGFAPDGATFFTDDLFRNAVRIWRTVTAPSLPLSCPEVGASAVRITRDGKRIATGHFDGTARIWDRSGRLRHVVGTPREVSTDYSFSLAFSPDGRLLVTSAAWKALLWDVERGELRQTFSHGPTSTPFGKMIQHVAFTSDGTEVLTASIDGTARRWSIDGSLKATFGTEASRLPEFGKTDTWGSMVISVDASPDGKWVLTGHMDGTARLWTRDGALHHTVPAPWPESEVSPATACFSPEGDRILRVANENTSGGALHLDVWAIDGGHLLHRRPLVGLRRVTFSPDGAYLAGAAGDGSSAQLLDATTGEAVASLRLRGVRIGRKLCFTPDGKYLLTARGEGLPVQAWFVHTDDLLREAERKTIRSFTEAERQKYTSLLKNPGKR